MKRLFSMKKYTVAVVTALGIVLTGTALWAVTVHEATGKGGFIDDAGNFESLQFKAGVDQFGTVFGQVQQTTHFAGSTPDLKWHGTVTCFELLSSTTAAFGGIIDSSSDPSLVGQFFEVKVVDNSPDLYGFVITKTPPDCLHVTVKLQPLTQGSITVD